MAKKAHSGRIPACMVPSVGKRVGVKSASAHKLIRHPSLAGWVPGTPQWRPANSVVALSVVTITDLRAASQPKLAPPQLESSTFAVQAQRRNQNRLEENALTAALVRRCISGDAVAWEDLVRQQNRRIYNICYRFTGSQSDAEDLTQEVFIRLYRTMGSYEPEKGSFTTWLTTLTRNMLVDHFRRTRQERLTDSIDAAPAADQDAPALSERIEDQSPSPQARLASQETQRMVQQALQRVSPDLREAVILRDLQDMDYKEIASALKVPEGTVKSRINRGRAELARLLSRINRQAV
jgi:RNA polymerase sigma factor (sigma-70 family)